MWTSRITVSPLQVEWTKTQLERLIFFIDHRQSKILLFCSKWLQQTMKKPFFINVAIQYYFWKIAGHKRETAISISNYGALRSSESQAEFRFQEQPSIAASHWHESHIWVCCARGWRNAFHLRSERFNGRGK